MTPPELPSPPPATLDNAVEDVGIKVIKKLYKEKGTPKAKAAAAQTKVEKAPKVQTEQKKDKPKPPVEAAPEATQEIATEDIVEEIAAEKAPSSIEVLRVNAAKAEAEYKALDKRAENWFGLKITDRKDKQAAAKTELDAAKAKYETALAEIAGHDVEAWLAEQSEELVARAKEYGDKAPKRSWLASKWEALGQWNLLEKLNIGKDWKKENDKEVVWDSSRKWNSALEKFQAMVSRGAYGAFSGRSLISLALLGGAGFSLAEGSVEAFTAFAGTRTGLAMAGSYKGGETAARAVLEWKDERKTKKTLRTTEAMDPNQLKQAQGKLANKWERLEEIQNKLNAGITSDHERNAFLKEQQQLTSDIDKDDVIEKRRFALEDRRATLEASYLLSGGRGASAEHILAEYKKVSAELADYAVTSNDAWRFNRVDQALNTMRANAQARTDRAIKKKERRLIGSKIFGAGLAGLAGLIGSMRAIDGQAMIDEADRLSSGNISSRPEAATAPASEDTKWQPEKEAVVPPKPSVEQMNTWNDVAKNQPAAAAQLGKALGENGPIPLHKLEAIAKANHLLSNPEDLKTVLKAAVSIEIDSDLNQYGKALEAALKELHENAVSGDPDAIAALKKFLASDGIGMKDADIEGLSDAQIHKAMLRKVNMHGANGEVGADVKNKVHFKNRLIVTKDGEVRVIQAAGKEAADRVPEKLFLQNLARKVGADPNSVSFKNGWGEVGMKLKGHEISIKNPHNFESYESVREHAEAQIIETTKEAIAENPMRKLPWVTFKHPDTYGNLSGVNNFRGFLINTEGATGYGVAEIPHDLLPGLSVDTKLFAIDIGSIDQNPERFGVAVASEAHPGKSIAAEILQPNGTPKQILKEAAEGAISVRSNIERLDDFMGLTRDLAIEFAHINGVPLDSTPAVFGEFVEKTRELYNQLGKTWKPLLNGTTWDKTNIKIMGALPDYSGNKLQTLLAEGKTMTKLSFEQKIAALESLGSKSPKALGALLDADKVTTLTNTTTSYDASQRILTIKNIEVNGQSIKSITIDTSLGIAKKDPGFWSSTKTEKLDSIKKLFVR